MKRFATILLALMMVLAMTGCGAASYDKSTNAMEAPMAAAPMEEMGYDGMKGEVLYGASGSISDSAANPGASEQKLIKRVSIDAETEDLEPLLTALNEKIAALNGYVEQQELYNGSAYSSYRSRSASLVIRIPAENLGGFVDQVKGISNVVTYNESTENVTLTYVATESRVKALQVEEERLLELLSKAENMADLLEIESRLTDVRYELENVTSQLRVLSNQVSYATVNLYISQVRVYTEVEPQTVWQRIGSGFKENLHDIGEDLTDLFVWLTVYSPQLILWAVIIAAAVVLLKKKLPRRGTKRSKKAPFETPKEENE